MRKPLLSLAIAGIVLTSCQEKADISENVILKFNAQRITSLQEQIDIYDHQLVSRDAGQKNLADVQEAFVQARLKRVAVRNAQLDLSKEVSQINADLAQYKVAVRNHVRTKAFGEKFAMIEIPGGRTFHDVEIKKVTDAGLVVKHRNGRARLLFKDLPTDLRNRFFYDETAAESLLDGERAVAARYDRRIARMQQKKIAAKTEQMKKKTAEMIAASPAVPSISYSNHSSRSTGSDWRSRRYSRNHYRSYNTRSYWSGYSRRSRAYSCPAPRRQRLSFPRARTRPSTPSRPYKPGPRR